MTIRFRTVGTSNNFYFGFPIPKHDPDPDPSIFSIFAIQIKIDGRNPITGIEDESRKFNTIDRITPNRDLRSMNENN